MEDKQNFDNPNPQTANDPPKQTPLEDHFPTRKPEIIFGLVTLVFGLMLGNFFIFGGGMNLGFAIALLGCLAAAAVYLGLSGCKGSGYAWTVLILCAAIIPGFARTDDAFVKIVLGSFLFVGINLGLTNLAGKNLWDPASVRSLLEPFRSFFGLGFGKLPESFQGIRAVFTGGGTAARNTGAVLVGAAIAVPILAVMIPLLMSADAAFEGLLKLLPEFDFHEAATTILLGGGGACILYTRTVALKHGNKPADQVKTERKGLSSLTMNTALFAVGALYVVYLLSQLAYFAGGFSGILPEGYSLAEYARRGFFEMAWLCAINLSVMILGISVTEKREEKTPLSTRIACLFIGLVTLFLVFAAGAKMVLYIGAFGMTRLRVLTMVIMGFLGLTTAVVSIWLFTPKLPYMKVVVISALVIGGGVLWTDVDTVVAKYNVESYLDRRLDAVDVDYLNTLGSGAVPYIDQLARQAEDPQVRQDAAQVLGYWHRNGTGDFRAWSYTDWVAQEILKDWPVITPDWEYPGWDSPENPDETTTTEETRDPELPEYMG